jgi:hypothetical protein
MNFKRRLLTALFISITAHFAQTFGQQPATKPTPTAPAQDEVLRIETELVQTPVMVFDKQGRFVDKLKRESFELRVDGQVQPSPSLNIGVVLNDEGKATGSFNGRLTANNSSAEATRPEEQTVFQVARTQIKTGLYQVRVAARATKSGSTTQCINFWVE